MLNLHPTNPTMDANGNRYQTVVIDGLMFTILKSSEPIEAKSKTGAKTWVGHIVRSPIGDYYLTSSWYNVNTKTGKQSVTQWATPYKVEPKNVGRSNETTADVQAVLEFDSMVKKELDKRASERPLPMLAQSYSKRKSKIVFPAYVQPKYDGMRMLYDGKVAWSRGSKEILSDVIQHLHFDTHGHIIDGELILPHNPKVNEVMKAAKKYRRGISDQLVYRVYDIVDTSGNLSFDDRLNLLSDLVNRCRNKNIILSDTQRVDNEDEINIWHSYFTEQGFEGTMIRNIAGKYSVNARSDDLQKHKDFIDAEFEIVDVIPSGGGTAAEVGKFVCKTVSGELFESTATGTYEERREYLVNKSNYIGKFAKVKYRELSGANSVPFHSNVLEIREEGDF